MKCLIATLAVLAVLLACERENRDFTPPAASSVADAPIVTSSLASGAKGTDSAAVYDANAYAMSEGKRLFAWFNCVGCHSHGGGGMGPPLMDENWIYGAEPANIFASIVEGRPNGMPSFRRRLNDDDVWKLVSYVRSMSGLQRKDVRPTRNDEMWYMPSEQRREPRPPRQSGPANQRE